MMSFHRVFRVGRTDLGSVWVAVDYDGRGLSFTGVEGPFRNGNCSGSCGQLDKYLRTWLEREAFQIDPAWTVPELWRLLDYWRDWHLNDMRAGCEHQRAAGWEKRPIDPEKPLDSYGLHFEGQSQPSSNTLMWVTREDHPQGLLSEPCPDCGYRFGTSWLLEPVGPDVLAWLRDRPDADKPCPWPTL